VSGSSLTPVVKSFREMLVSEHLGEEPGRTSIEMPQERTRGFIERSKITLQSSGGHLLVAFASVCPTSNGAPSRTTGTLPMLSIGRSAEHTTTFLKRPVRTTFFTCSIRKRQNWMVLQNKRAQTSLHVKTATPRSI
jgi:hypothetical protein